MYVFSNCRYATAAFAQTHFDDEEQYGLRRKLERKKQIERPTLGEQISRWN
jgi:hypothetical protein